MAENTTNQRVAIVHDWLTGMRGGEKVLEQIVRLFPDAPIYTLFHLKGSVSEELERRSIHTSFLQKLPFLERRYRHYLPLFPRAIESFDLAGYDLVVSTSHCVAKGIIVGAETRHLCYCHTPMRYVWDQQRIYFPKSNSPLALTRDALLSRLRRWDRKTAHRPTQYLANSSFVQERIKKYYDRESSVLAPPVDVDFFTPPDATSHRHHLLCVAALNAYKKVDLAISAAAELDLPLVIVGRGPDQAQLQEQARSLGHQTVDFRSGIPATELRELYRHAIAFVQPGIEDFGIAAAESLACGTPVVAAAEGGVLDIVEHRSEGILYDSKDRVKGLMEAIQGVKRLHFDPRQAAHRAQRFSENAFTSQLQSAIAALRT